MRITSVVLTPAGSADTCTLSFRDPTRQNPYNVQSIAGLDASDGVVPKFYGNASNSAARFYSMFLQKRDAVISIGLNPNFALGKSYSGLRDDLYKMISSSRTGLVTVSFSDENGVIANISGFVIKFESDLFQKDPSVIITLSAVNPMLISPNPVNVAVGAVPAPGFTVTDLLSTAPHALSFTATALAAAAALTISDPNDASWSFTVTPVGGFLVGDQLTFSSEPLNKQLYLVRGGVTTYLADVISPGSVWPVMFPGANTFYFTNPASWTIPSFSYYPTYWGV